MGRLQVLYSQLISNTENKKKGFQTFFGELYVSADKLHFLMINECKILSWFKG
jgi:hypothetical protein